MKKREKTQTASTGLRFFYWWLPGSVKCPVWRPGPRWLADSKRSLSCESYKKHQDPPLWRELCSLLKWHDRNKPIRKPTLTVPGLPPSQGLTIRANRCPRLHPPALLRRSMSCITIYPSCACFRTCLPAPALGPPNAPSHVGLAWCSAGGSYWMFNLMCRSLLMTCPY